MDAYTACTHAHTGVLRKLSGNVSAIPVQGFDVGRGKRKEFRGNQSQMMKMSLTGRWYKRMENLHYISKKIIKEKKLDGMVVTGTKRWMKCSFHWYLILHSTLWSKH